MVECPRLSSDRFPPLCTLTYPRSKASITDLPTEIKSYVSLSSLGCLINISTQHAQNLTHFPTPFNSSLFLTLTLASVPQLSKSRYHSPS